MKSFKRFTIENTVSYGDLQPHDEAKIREDDKIISYFRNSGVLSTYENRKYPSNQETMRELLYLKNRISNLSDENLLFALNAETDEYLTYRNFTESINLKLPETFIPDIINQTDPILFYLKKYHNRARPEQFAAVYNIPFQVTIPHTALNPAYPSGHALDSYILEHYFKLLAPEHSDRIEEFCRKMRESRLDAGLHYPSDNEISKDLAHDIIKHKLIQIPGA